MNCVAHNSNATWFSYSMKSRARWNGDLRANGISALALQGRTFSKSRSWRDPALVDQLSYQQHLPTSFSVPDLRLPYGLKQCEYPVQYPADPLVPPARGQKKRDHRYRR